jgi:hypothetical protein
VFERLVALLIVAALLGGVGLFLRREADPPDATPPAAVDDPPLRDAHPAPPAPPPPAHQGKVPHERHEGKRRD